MRFENPLVRGTLVKKHRRSIVDVRLESGNIVRAHCPTMGLMNAIPDRGNTVLLSDSGLDTRRHPLTWEMIDLNGTWVGVNAAMARKVLVEALEAKTIPSLAEFSDIQVDATYGHGKRIDVMLLGMEHNCFIHTFHVTWVENESALFPDAPGSRIAKSMRELTEIVQSGHRAVAFFFVQRKDCSRLKLAEEVDSEFLKATIVAQNAGVEMIAYRGDVSPDSISLADAIPCAFG
jgi:sugar fermentation stimulation protein A